MYSSFVSSGKFIPRYLILFVAVVNWIGSFISLSDFSLLVYRNASDFCVLILFPATFAKFCILQLCWLALVIFWYYLYYVQYHVICKQWELYFFFSDLDSFISFSSLISIARTSRTMLNNSAKVDTFVLFLILRGMLSVFHHWEKCFL